MDNTIIELIIPLIKGTYDGALVVGSNTPDNCISLRGNSTPFSTFLCKQQFYMNMTILLNGKSDDQRYISDVLSNIHLNLSKMITYPSTDEVQIVDISTMASPNLIGREENSQWLYGSTLQVKYYIRG